MSRKTIAGLILLIWVAALGLLYNRTSHRTPEQALTEAGMRVSPATYYYIVEQGGNQVGAASSSLDTTSSRIVATDFIRGAIPVGGGVLRMEARSEARFTRGLRLRDFVIRAAGDLTPFTLRGVMQEGEDTILRITLENESKDPITLENVASLPVFIPTVSPLPLMLRGAPSKGDSVRIAMFDPMTRTLRDVAMRVETDSLFLIADSAHVDTATGQWVKARQDSLRGWRITGRNSPVTAWVDADGRLIAASEPGGISLVRTAYEIAFENWKSQQQAKGAPPM